jgi:exopolysaccharide biosynthesis protein
MKKKMFYAVDCIVIAVLLLLTVLDTFVISRTYVHAEERKWTETVQQTEVSEMVSADTETEMAEVSLAEEDAETQIQDDGSGTGNTAAGETVQENETAEEMIVYEEAAESENSDSEETVSEPVVTESSYSDENLSVSIEEYWYNDTTIYVADVQVSSAEYLYAALAQNTYGKNVKEKTSEMAEENNAILAINGDYYGAQEKGYVLRNGVIYRNTAEKGQEDLVIYEDGSFEIIVEDQVAAQELLDKGAVQILSFGPALVTNSEIAVTTDEEVGKAKSSNPRTAIGVIDDLHYVFVVSDGRTGDSEGLSLYELASFMEQLGVQTAYNLDGGGSSTMVFRNQIINNPTGGFGNREREVSDIVYIG